MSPSLRERLRGLVSSPGAREFLGDRLRLDPKRWRGAVITDVTHGCNLRCPMCEHLPGPRRTAGPEQWERLAEEVVPHAAEVALGCRHEPLLHPELGAGLAALRRAADETGDETAVCLLTSGTLLGERSIARLVSARPHALLLSIDTTDEDAYAELRPPARWETLRPKVAALVRGVDPGVTSLAVQTLIMRRTLPLLLHTVAELAGLGIRRFQLSQLTVTPAARQVLRRDGAGESDLMEATETLRRLAERDALVLRLPSDARRPIDDEPYPVFGEGDVWDEDRLRRSRPVVCVAPWGKLRIDCDGWAYPCPHKDGRDVSWGNLNTLGLEGVLNSARAIRTRELLLRGRAPDAICGACAFGPGPV